MGFKFSYVCDLLSSLEANCVLKTSTSSTNKNPDYATVTNWFRNHRKRIDEGVTDRLALLSCLFPEKRPDRVYGLQEPSLVKVIGRCLLLGASRRKDLDAWRFNGGGDLGECVEIVMRQSENLIQDGKEVTIDEIDAALTKIASRSRFSGPKIRQRHTAVDVDFTLRSLFLRLTSRDAKWLTRMILKNYGQVVLPFNCVFRNLHFLLPGLLLLQDSFEAAIDVLNSEHIKAFPPRPDPDYAKLLSDIAMDRLAPRIGTKVGRPDFYKARSIKHCCQMAEKRKMGLERKYDGEYCQIHIDLSRGEDCVQIFSKSGKDSTVDKRGIHKALKQCLGIGQKGCKFSKHCILEGELLVWSDKDKNILEFHKLRKHITRAGKFLGTDNDSQPHDYEHLMMMFFDVLLIDDNSCLGKPYHERRTLLKETVKPRVGRAEIAEKQCVDFGHPDSNEWLRETFAKGITARWEGFVLKGWDDPYFTFLHASAFRGRWIKLKKDLIPGLGDTADFAIIGARYDARYAPKLNSIKKLLWTSFHVGCLENKIAVLNTNATPRFRVVDVLNHHNINLRDIETINQFGQFRSCDINSENAPLVIRHDQDELKEAEVLFKTPFVVEMVGSGFDKPHNVNYFQLRFPRVLKIHFDRNLEDVTTFHELQKMAEDSRLAPQDEASQEAALWAQMLDKANGRSEYIVDKSQPSSPSTDRSMSPSSRKSLSSSRRGFDPGLLPSSQTQAETGGFGEYEQKTRTSNKVALGTKSYAPGCDDDCFETLPIKRARKQDSQRSSVLIFNDSPHRTSPPRETSVEEIHSCLTDVVNIGTQPKPQHTTDLIASAKSTQEQLIDENSLNGRQDVTINIEAQQSISYEKMSVSQETNASKTTSSLHVCTLSKQVDITASREKSESAPKILNRDTDPATFPMLIGRFLFKQQSHPLKSILPNAPISASFSINHFLDTVISKWNEDNTSPSEEEDRQPALGIAFVDFSESSATDTAEDIDAICNRLAFLQQQNASGAGAGDNVKDKPSIGWPENGKIFFLDWRALERKPISDRPVSRKYRWDKVAKACFAGCVIWGYGGPRGYDISETNCQNKKKGKRMADDIEGDSCSGGEREFGDDIWTSWSWREVYSLQVYKLGF